MTDVPGHTIGMVPIMHDADIRFLHIGVNQATPLPPVPPIFKWKYDNKEIIVMYQGDYGEVAEFDDFIVYFAHTHDNLGPQSANEVKKIYKTICNEYPDYKIKAATLDDVARRIETLKDLPIIDKEIGDTWIHGAGTDPQKISRYRNVLRYISEHKNSDVDLTDNLLLIPEHTCGMDVKTHFHDLRHYTPLQMNKCKDKRRKIEKSWEEQRNYVYNAEKLLNIKTDYPINEPDLSLYEETEIPDNFNIEVSWQIFDRDDYNRYKKDYMRSHVYWAIWDFTKVGLPQYQRDIYDAKIVKCYKNGDDIIYKLEFDSQIAKKHGLPYFYLQLKENRIELKWFGKKASRIPQACWLKIKGLNEDWELNKMDVWIKPDDILGSPLISAVDQGVRNKDYVIKPLDSVLVAPYGRKLLQYNVKEKNQDLYFNLYNNIWNTNFPIWYSDDALFRFDILQITN